MSTSLSDHAPTPQPRSNAQRSSGQPERGSLKSSLRGKSFAEGEAALEPTLGDELGAAWSLSSELHDKPGGSSDSTKANAALMRTEPGQRAAEAVKIIRLDVCNNRTFHMLSAQLMGGPPNVLADCFQRLAPKGESLSNAITRVFGGNKWRHFYLLTVARFGEPDLMARLSMAAGLVTGSKAMQSEIARLVEDADPKVLVELEQKRGPELETIFAAAEEYLGIFTTRVGRCKSALDGAKKELAFDAASAEAKRLEDVKKEKDDKEKAEEQGAKLQAGKAWDELVDARSRQLVTIYRDRWKIGLGIQRKVLAEDLLRVCKGWDPKLRHAVSAPGSALQKFLVVEAHNKNFISVTGRGTGSWILNLVAELALPPSEWFEEEATAQKKQLEKGKGEEAAPDTELFSDDARSVLRDLYRKKSSKKEVRHVKAAVLMDFTTIEERIAQMSADARFELLLGYLSESEREQFFDPEATSDTEEKLRAVGLERFREQALVPTGASSVDLKRLLGAFAKNATRGGHRASSPYGRLRALAASKIVYLDYGTRVMRYATQLSGDEIAEVTRDSALMATLERRIGGDKTSWSRLCKLLDYDQANAERAAKGDQEATEKRELAGRNADLRPEHWVVKLERELTKTIDLAWHAKVVALVNRTIDIAELRSELPIEGEILPMHHKEFLAEVRGGLSKKANDALAGETLRPARVALETGTRVTALDQIDASTFHDLNPKRLKGVGLNRESLADAIAAAHGKQLLEDWSNYPVWRDTIKALDALRKDGPIEESRKEKVQALESEVESFTLDVDPIVHRRLEMELEGADLVGALSAIRERLADAMANDDAFKAQADKRLDMGAFSQERTRVLGALDEQRLEDSGFQWNTISSGSTLRKESRDITLGRVRTGNDNIRDAEGDKKKETKDQVDREQAPKVTESREELARRTATFQKVRDTANAIATGVVSVTVGALLTGVALGTSAATFGGGTPIWAAMLFAGGVSLGTSAATIILEKLLKGDKFNATEAFTRASMDALVATLSGSAIGLSEVLLAGVSLSDALRLVAQGTIKVAITSSVKHALKAPLDLTSELDPSLLPTHALRHLVGFMTEIAGTFIGMAPMSPLTGTLDDKQLGGLGGTLEDGAIKGMGKISGKVHETEGQVALAGVARVRALYAQRTKLDKRSHGDIEEGKSDKVAEAGARATTTLMARGTMKRAVETWDLAESMPEHEHAKVLKAQADELYTSGELLLQMVAQKLDTATLIEATMMVGGAARELEGARAKLDKSRHQTSDCRL